MLMSMQDVQSWLTLISAITAAIVAVIAAIKSDANGRNIAKVQSDVNGRMDQLLDVTKTSSHAEGVREQKALGESDSMRTS